MRSSAILRAAATSGAVVVITMPGATFVPQLGTNPFARSTFTRQTQQEANGSSRLS